MLKSLWVTSYLAIVPMLLGWIIFYFLPTFHWDYQLFHVFLEGGGALIAFMLALFVTTMIKQQRLAINYIWLIACFISMGILDLAHSQIPPGQAFVWLHSSATLIGGFFAALIWLPEKISKKFAHKSFLFILTIICIGFSIWSIVLPEMSLMMLDEHKEFTLSAEIFNLVGGISFMVAWGYFALKYHQQHHPDSFYFSNHFCLFGLAGLLFEASILWDGNWWLWHSLRAFAYLLLAFHFVQMYWDDLDALKQKTNALKQEKERFEVLFEKSGDGIVVIEHGVFIDCNEQAVQMMGYDNKQALLKHPGDLSPPYQPDGQSSIEKANEMMTQCLQKGSSKFEWMHRKKNGDVFWADILLTQLDYQGKQVIHTVMRDISKEKEAEKIKDNFLANMSHELRTPINGVLGITELLSNTNLSKIQRNYLETIQVSGETLLLVLNDILDNSKMDAGDIFFQENEFNPNDILEHITSLLTQSAANKNIELISDITLPESTHYAVGDPDRIRQILMNLANNAIKFTSQGEVCLKVITQEKDQTIYCRFEVHDTGIGIEKEYQKILFDPFVQVDSSNTRKQMGTGLGLSICKKLVEAMGGSIGVNSTIGKGSQFWFTLTFPCGGELNHLLHYNLEHLRILLVDDNSTNLKIISGLAKYWLMPFTAVNNGLSALHEAKKAFQENQEYKIAIIDHQMPGMDGIEVIQKIKADPNLKGIKTLLLSSLDQDFKSENLQEMGIDGYLRKPARSSDLYNLVLKLVHVTTGSVRENKTVELPNKENKLRHETILVVEDTAINQIVIVGLLEQLGFTAACVNNGQEAVDAYKTNDYALIFMDMQMPIMDGYEATRVIRNLEKTQGSHETTIIALTANAMDGESEKVYKAGMNDYLTKPINPDLLKSALNKWLPKMANHVTNEILNFVVFNELKSSLGNKNSQAILSATLMEIEKRVETLYELIANDDRALLQITAHGLKGESATLGASFLSETCKKMEFMAEKGEKHEIIEQMDKINFAATKTIKILKTQVKEV
jgi:PAS domain S-box-containing protein